MKQVRTARGRMIDMSALAKVNEEMRAVSPGNVIMNARGDRLDSSGNVVQTVQAKSKAARDTTSAPEKRRLSEAPGAPKEKKTVSKKEASATQGPIIVTQTEKTRDDGTRYLEIEYDDGSMDVKELE